MSKRPKKLPSEMLAPKPGEPLCVAAQQELVVAASRALLSLIERDMVEPVQLIVIVREGMEALTAYAATVGDEET